MIFKLNNTQSGNRIGLGLLNESSKISGEIFEQALSLFVKDLPQKRGFEKNLFAKKFIKGIIYSKDQIQINLFYFYFPDDNPLPLGAGKERADNHHEVADAREPKREGLNKSNFLSGFKQFETKNLAPRVGLTSLNELVLSGAEGV